jgi:uncharacterized protein YjbJ (UPF0337 family)
MRHDGCGNPGWHTVRAGRAQRHWDAGGSLGQRDQCQIGSSRERDPPLKRKEFKAMKNKIKGTATELKGKATGNKSEELKGKVQKAAGIVEQSLKNAVHDVEHPKNKKK